ncbi:MAG TPA: hypothetical protein VHS99_12450 [Chloroflexota bacterium]|jgi:5'-methylthioadenosine phosphorylase|nr:hypothetical protein [Chloroflexota bacterium]
MVALQHVPEVAFANVGGSGSWGYRFPEGVFAPDAPLQVRRLEGPLVFETPYGDSPPFGLYELSDARRGLRRPFLRVWMHGQQPGTVRGTPDDPYAGTPMRAAEKVFAVLRRARTKWILIDASVGGINRALDPWDLVIAHDFFDDMKRVPRMEDEVNLSLRYPYCRHLRRVLFEAAGRQLGRYTQLAQRVMGQPVYPKIVRRGVYVCPDGPWFESYAQIADYQHRGFDVVGKTLVPEVQLARAIGAHFGCLNPVVNPAEGLVDPDTGAVFPWGMKDLFRIYDAYGPVISAMVMEAMASIDTAAPGCLCEAVAQEGANHTYDRFLEA